MVQIYVLCGGYLEMNHASMIPDSAEGRWTIPVACYLITQPEEAATPQCAPPADPRLRWRQRAVEARQATRPNPAPAPAASGGARSAAGSPTPLAHPTLARGEKVRLQFLSSLKQLDASGL